MAYEVTLDERAVAQLRALPKKLRRQVFGRIEALADNPWPGQSEKLKGTDGLWLLRSGSHRIIYAVEGQEVFVLKVADRRDVYDALAHLEKRFLRRNAPRKK